MSKKDKPRIFPKLSEITKGDVKKRVRNLLLVFDNKTPESTKNTKHILEHYGFVDSPGPQGEAYGYFKPIQESIDYLEHEGYVKKYSEKPDFYKLTRKGKREQKRLSKESRLEGRMVASVLAIAGLGASIFFLQSNITGNAIADLSSATANIIGAGLFILGIIGSYFYFKKR